MAALLATPAAVAKDFDPGDLRLCNAKRCVPILNRHALKSLAGLYYVAPQPERAPAVRLGVPYYQLRFRNGYVTGIVASAKLDRFLSYGVYLGRFQRGTWYRMPDVAARELRHLAAGLTPLRVTREALARSR
ncbi:MAG: hypothetical protein WD981_05835 [Gaiellaceae bacterium]